MEINVKILFMWTSFTITTVRQQTVQDPCPTNAPQSSIANMCQAEVGKEEDDFGGPRVDSVALRITTREDNCVCKVYLQNQTENHTVVMSTYDGKTSAAPEHPYCGLEINVSLSAGPDNNKSLKTVDCTNGNSVRLIQLKQNEMLRFTSTFIEGRFTRGYCLQIFRQDMTKYPALQIQCSQGMTNETSNSQTVIEDDFSTQYVIIGTCAVASVFVLTLAVVFMYTRRKRNDDPVIVKSDNGAGNDSEGLKHNILYQTSEQWDITDGNYHTVELQERQVVNNTQNIDGDYISIDENFGTNRKNTPNPGIQPKCKTQITKENLNNKIQHVARGTVNNVEYAVVSKRDRLGENTEHATAPSTEYAVVDKSGGLGENIKHVTPENGSNVEYAVVEKNTQI